MGIFKEFLTNYYFPKFYEEKTIKKIYSYGKSGGNFYQFDKVYDEIEKYTCLLYTSPSPRDRG